MAERKIKEHCVAKKDERLWWNKKDGKGYKVLQGAVENKEGLRRHCD